MKGDEEDWRKIETEREMMRTGTKRRKRRAGEEQKETVESRNLCVKKDKTKEKTQRCKGKKA